MALERRIEFQCSVLEKEMFEDAASLASLTVSAWIRTRLREVAAEELVGDEEDGQVEK